MTSVTTGFDAARRKGYQSVKDGVSGGAKRMKAHLGLIVAGLALAGCVEQVAVNAPEAALTRRAKMPARPGVSPGGATVALASLDGAPQAINERFSQAFAAAARGREIVLAPAPGAHYIVRGYLDAHPAPGGTMVAYVWDVFDARKSRAQRVADSIVVPGAGADPWSVVDDKALASVAGKAAEDLAAFLTNTPEAVAAVKPDAAAKPASSAAPAPGGVSVAPMTQAAAPASPALRAASLAAAE